MYARHVYKELCVPVESVRGRPGGCDLHGLDVFGCHECVSGQRSFAFYGSTLWNTLPSALREGQ